MIPEVIKIKNGALPDHPGVYFYYDENGHLLYIGKATSLKKRVGSYFTKAHDARITDLVSKIRRIEYIETPTVIEALVLEANKIHYYQPPYNILVKDDKSFLYLCFTNEDFPRPIMLRGLDLERLGIEPFSKKLTEKAKKYFCAVYGPYTSGRAVKLALDLIRPAMPWSICTPPGGTDFPMGLFTGQRSFGFRRGSKDGRPCFDAQIRKCPGVCSGKITKKEYRKIIRRLIQFFDGKKQTVLRDLTKAMQKASRAHRFEEAAALRNQVSALAHIKDVGLIMRDEDVPNLPLTKHGTDFIHVLGRIEAYDIANISGSANVASMVVFEGGRPAKNEYRRFRIKSFEGANDVGSMEEIIRRRLARNQKMSPGWTLPDIMIIDGGEGQVNRVRAVMEEFDLKIPIIGIAKGFDRKQDRLVFDESNKELVRVATTFKEIFQRARDEAHRFAGAYHRNLRSRLSGVPRRKKKAL